MSGAFWATDVVRVGDLTAWILARSDAVDRYVFGIAGPPGSGKSTLAGRLGADVDAPVVPMDGFHLPNATLDARGLRDVKGSPVTFAATEFVDVVRALRDPNRLVACPMFDRTIDEPIADRIRVSSAARVVIVEGNYLLLDRAPWSSLSGLFDAIAYLDVPAEVRLQRLIERHVEFGRSRADAEKFVRRSDWANTALIEATKAGADLVISMDD